MAEQSASISHLAIDWSIACHTGWGVYALNLALQARRHNITPVVLAPSYWATLHPIQRASLAAAEANEPKILNSIAAAGGKTLAIECPMLIACSGHFDSHPHAATLTAPRRVAIWVSECAQIIPQAIERGRQMDWIIASSTWNEKTLRRHGFQNVSLEFQGFDPTLFSPGPRAGLLGDLFAIFSGGKLEYRKGQDIVIAAVREFRKRHNDVVLVFAWSNPWPETARDIAAAGLVDQLVLQKDGSIDFVAWLKNSGLGNTNVINLGAISNWQMPMVLREMDVALLPSRCEGATNFVAMECIASGVPTILSANTGHLDLINMEGCYPLHKQDPVRPTTCHAVVDQWGESSIDEILEYLERIYRDRAESRRQAMRGSEAIQWMTWEKRFPEILKRCQK
ncbi:MAG TPA: glycosyltransferase family 4 protein [Tepidisphaeraceae bacterium]|nr:glycosyltransferase family 4 protein [Tepidisphaeraceae bacterium]